MGQGITVNSHAAGVGGEVVGNKVQGSVASVVAGVVAVDDDGSHADGGGTGVVHAACGKGTGDGEAARALGSNHTVDADAGHVCGAYGPGD